MESKEGERLCMICCKSYPTDGKSIDNEDSIFKDPQFVNFCRQLEASESEDGGNDVGEATLPTQLLNELTSDNLQPGKNNVAVCPPCFQHIGTVVETNAKVTEVEAQVLQLKQQLSLSLKELEDHIDQLQKDMKGIGTVLKSSNEVSLKEMLKKSDLITAADSRDSVFLFREKIMSAIECLGAYKENVSQEISSCSHRISRRRHKKSDEVIILPDIDYMDESVQDDAEDGVGDPIDPMYPIVELVESSSGPNPSAPPSDDEDDIKIVAEIPVQLPQGLPVPQVMMVNSSTSLLGLGYNDLVQTEDGSLVCTNPQPAKESAQQIVRVMNSDQTFFGGMPPWKQYVLMRILNRAMKIITNSDDEYADKDDPRSRHYFGWSEDTGNLNVGGVDIIIEDSDKSFRCSLCNFRCVNSYSAPVEKAIHDHILGSHFKVYQCPICSAFSKTYGAHRSHVDCHSNCCKWCGTGFTTGSMLLSHEMSRCYARPTWTNQGIKRNSVQSVTEESLPKRKLVKEGPRIMSSFTLTAPNFEDRSADSPPPSSLFVDEDDIQYVEHNQQNSGDQCPEEITGDLLDPSLPSNTESAMRFSLFIESLKVVSLPRWKRTVFRRLTERAKKILNNEDDEYPDGDLRKQLFFDFNRFTNNLNVGGIDVVVNDENQSLDCSTCGFRATMSQGIPIEKVIHDHVLGIHLNAYKCHQCLDTYSSYELYLSHVQTCQEPRSNNLLNADNDDQEIEIINNVNEIL